MTKITAKLDLFETWLREQDRSLLTMRGYLNDIRGFLVWYEQTNGVEGTLADITPTDLREYRQYLSVQRKCAPSTIARKLASLRAFFRWAMDTRRIESNPTSGVKLPRKQELSPQWLDKRQVYALEREVDRGCQLASTPAAKFLAERDRAILIVFLHCGLRIAELCALDLADVTLSERKGSLIVRGKGGKQRLIPLNEHVRRALRAWLAVRSEIEMRDAQALFVDRNGKRITPSGVHRRIAAIGQRAGVELHAHLLRHTFAKRLLDSGVGLEQVAALLGHTDLNTTRVYVVPGERDLERAVAVLEG